MAFERVYTVWDYYDGIRSGIAEYLGQPHYYQCEWDEAISNYADTFILTPIDNEILSLALEQWKIWREWEQAFHRGEVPESTHPAEPGQHLRYAELESILKARISSASPLLKRVQATFRVLAGQSDTPPGVMRDLEVEWRKVS